VPYGIFHNFDIFLLQLFYSFDRIGLRCDVVPVDRISPTAKAARISVVWVRYIIIVGRD
jgi:hypothetical protein